MDVNKDRIRHQLMNMYLLAMADGTFDEKEQLFLAQRARQFDLSLDELFDIINEANEINTGDVPESLQDRVKNLYDLAQIIWSDGKVSSEERAVLISFIRKYGFVEENVEDIATYLLEEAQKGSEVQSIIDQIQNN
ncbi:TerB family tellurite resistance protein [Porphyromonas sp. COT-239 OH1446]|uniref:TerB family tellurite resistance protein n=1 Tax=Porphyromonas sp. COT-239 OH1446 TaxID=1515613 RepID=UPI00052C2792|nr:TerB family tellurite resistance protein [Porphyromonas sp. COT-239 OH1446]KGN71934.1 hypothetical protein HQ37_01155 [Porphyromonas sp. COT-239 OH1446]